jgi:DNA-binding transcriptional LysR family regulator
LELHQVRYFVAISRLLNFTRAAEQCNVTQPALTKAIRKLELELGGELIHRERQLTQLTALGKLVLPTLEQLVAAADTTRLAAREYQRKRNASLKIGLTPCVSASVLVAPLGEIAQLVPGLQVEIVEDSAGRLSEMLFDGGIGAALTGECGTLPQRIDRWPLFEERFVVLTSESNRLAEFPTIPLHALADTIWLERVGCEIAHRFWETCFTEDSAPKIIHRGRHESHLQHMAAAGLGSMLASENTPHVASLTARHIEGDPLRRTVQLIAIAGRRYSPALDAFVKIARSRNWNRPDDVMPGSSERVRSLTAPERPCARAAAMNTWRTTAAMLSRRQKVRSLRPAEDATKSIR